MAIAAFPVACGTFIGAGDVDPDELARPGFALVPSGFRWKKGSYLVRLFGRSMEPRIADGSWGIIHPWLATDPQSRIVLVEERNSFGD